ncbi:hypothetical protein EBZ39_19545 [bacterium]|nr:hypothetical protein [bacterium]
MSYTAAPACQLLATHCCCCGRPLVDSVSVELGIGPECRKGDTGGIDAATQDDCNRLTRSAAVAAQSGNVERVREIAETIESLGLSELANKIRKRFVNAEKRCKITIVDNGDMLIVETPFRRKDSSGFIEAWRNIPGRRYDRNRNANVVPVNQKRQLLQRFFPGEFGKGPQGIFRIPEAA